MSGIDGTQKAVSLVATISYLFMGIGFFFVPFIIYAYSDYSHGLARGSSQFFDFNNRQIG